ncbi:MAG: replicative DNA helicase [Candidatus Dojkabacteria bacterium]|nr:MAG: replicative DNA helicase [Candidatus Dojkabacteria bacterium]
MPPHNLEAEQAVLGAVLIDNEVLIKVVDQLDEKHFYEPRNRIIFEQIRDLFSKNLAVDVLTLSASLKKKKKFEQVGGSKYIGDLAAIVPTSANIDDYIKIIKENAHRRSLISYASKLDELARQEERDIEDILDELESDLLAITQSSIKTDFLDSETLLEMQMKLADEYAKNPNALRGHSTGLKSVDHLLGGLHKSDLIILAARPSVGKSAFAFDIARHVAVNEKKNVAIFSLEMPAVQVITRMLAQQIEVSLWKLRMGGLKDSEFKKYNMGVAKLADAGIFIDDSAGLNIMQLRSKARKLMLEKKLDLIVIDYLQLMQGHSRIENRTQEIGEISRSLKILARELNIPIIALSQLNRAVENRGERIPQLSDLRESGSIEQDADIVIFLSRDIMSDEQEDDSEKRVDVLVAKHRNGPTGRVVVKFRGEFQKFYDNE